MAAPIVRLLISAAGHSVKKDLQRQMANTAARVSRIEKKHGPNAHTERFRALQASIDYSKPTSIKQVQTLTKRVERVTTLKGTYAGKDSERLSRLFARAQTREATKEHLKRNPRLLPPAEDVKELTDSTLRSLRGKAKRVKAAYGDTHATRALDSWLEERNPNASPRQKTAELRRLLEISDYEGIDVKGAKKQQQRGMDAFGDQYKDWTADEKAAAWNGFKDYARSLSSNVRSDQVLADFKAAVAEGSLSVSFYTVKVSDGSGGKRDELRAAARPNLSAAVAEATKAKHQAEELQKIKDKTDPDTVAPLW